jgi:uncharacterized protein YkuJ
VASLAGKTIDLHCSQTTSMQSGSEEAKHQNFERSGPQWSVTTVSYVPPPWTVEVIQVRPSAESPISFQFDESLYIRPPPAV